MTQPTPHLRLHNTATRRTEDFAPIDPSNVRMYVCGPTVYDRAHLGNARPVVVFDVLYRLLRHLYGPDHVTYVRNFTDVDDKIIARAAESGRPIDAITTETTQWFLDDMAALGALEPDHMPRATAYIPQMVAMIEKLIEKGFAYPVREDSNNPPKEFILADREAMVGEHALFEVSKYEHYGELSGRSVDDMIAGARVEIAPYKRNPMDFVLWKPAAEGEPGWPSPWGKGRPGWHIECSAMAKSLLGDTFDIHAGGLDLMFPHHENELAQSCCANDTSEMARFWLHNEMLQVEGKKMSKSLGNFFTVRDLLDKGYPGEVIRFVMLSTHYRKPMDWTEKKAEEADWTLRKWWRLVADVKPSEPAPEVMHHLTNDLNTAGAINFLKGIWSVLNQKASAAVEQSIDPIDDDDPSWSKLAGEFVASARLLGLLEEERGSWTASPDLYPLARRLAELRTSALASKDFSKVDALKNALLEAGVEVRMSKNDVELVASAQLDTAKLEALK